MKTSNKSNVESILDINLNNIWDLEASDVAELWEASRKEEELTGSENKLLNTIRIAFDVYHYDPNDKRDVAKYEENEQFTTFSRVKEADGRVAISKRVIRRITDITYENVKHLTASQLLQLIDDNFGGGWDAIPLQIKDIIESGFEISTTTLPARRLHIPGGLIDKNIADGFEVLEITKGLWVEAIFVRKKELVEKVTMSSLGKYDDEGNRIEPSDEDFDIQEEQEDQDSDNSEEEENIDETYYETFIPEADSKNDDEDEL